MTDIVAFLKARLDEDEQVARLAIPGPWVSDGYYSVASEALGEGRSVICEGDCGGGVHDSETSAHIARHNPARVLADIDAKLRLLTQFELRGNSVRATVVPTTGGVWDDLLRMLALPYAEHADYDQRW